MTDNSARPDGEPVAWQPLKREDTLAILNDFRSREDTLDRAADRIEAYVGNAIASALKMIRARYAALPVRGDREAIVRIIDPDAYDERWAPEPRWENLARLETRADAQLRAERKADAILSLPAQPGVGEREAAIEECAKLVEGTGLRNPDNIARDIRALSRQAPHSSSEDGW